MITVVDYFKRFINPKVDLSDTPKICCPFHDEDTPSFSYKREADRWRCFGACKFGGDVIAMHQVNYKFKTREEAKASLYKILGIKEEPSFVKKESAASTNDNEIRYKVAYANAIKIAKTIEDWLELDYIMGQYPPNVDTLIMFTNVRKKATK